DVPAVQLVARAQEAGAGGERRRRREPPEVEPGSERGEPLIEVARLGGGGPRRDRVHEEGVDGDPDLGAHAPDELRGLARRKLLRERDGEQQRAVGVLEELLDVLRVPAQRPRAYRRYDDARHAQERDAVPRRGRV